MPSTAPVELDFLGLRPAAAAAAEDDHHHGSSSTSAAAAASSSIRGMKTSAIASIGAHKLRRVIAGDEAPKQHQQAPMTVFYGGAVATFDGVSQDTAEAIMKMAMEVTTSSGGRIVRRDAFRGNLTKDMPLTRTKSLQQFLHKRKERLSGPGPYLPGSGGRSSRVGAATMTFHVKEEAA
ncbi:Protein TIFY 9 [Zea mays]|uniref:Protein TIFY n=1 Tax=Zea mays TaxID=4577 RepID=A0A3L6G0L8_MAIZE|nr:Protein TIFY 9 [Zea mays]